MGRMFSVIEFAYKRSVYSFINFSPFEIVCGFDPLTPMDLLPLLVIEHSSWMVRRRPK